MPELDPDMAAVLKTIAETFQQPYSEIGVEAARQVSAERSRELNRNASAVASVRNVDCDGPHGTRIVRIYDNEPDNGTRPALLFLHGGGWVLGSLDSHDGVCRELAVRTGHVVASLDYGLAPEHRFPVAVDDSVAALAWLRAQAGELGVDPDRIAIGGDSAGANLAASVCVLCRDNGQPMPRAAALIYGCFSPDMESESHQLFGGGDFFLSTEMMAWFMDQYVPDQAQREDPRFHVNAADLSGLPPLYVSIAEFDPLKDDGEQFCRLARDAGVTVEQSLWTGVTHGSLQMRSLVPRVDGFLAEIADFLRRAGGPSAA